MTLTLFKRKQPKQVKFTENEYKAIKILTEQQSALMHKHENPDDQLKLVIGIIDDIHKKVKHI